MRLLRILPLLLLPLVLGMAGCNDTMATTASEETAGSGVVAFRFSSAQVDTLAKEVDTIEVVLDNGKEQRTLRTKLSAAVEFSDLPTGNWKLVVTLRRGGTPKYQGSTLVTIASGRTTEAKVVLSAVSGSLKVEIGFEKDGSSTTHPAALQRIWILQYLSTVDTLMVVPTIRLDSNGTAWINGVCGGEHKGTWMAEDSLLWIEQGVATTDLMNCKVGGDLAVAMTTVRTLFGRPLRWKVRTDTFSLVLSDAVSDTVIAVFAPYHATGLKPAMEPQGTWYLSELQGTGSVSDTIPLVLSENGMASGSDGCNHWSGKWSAPTDSTLKVAFGMTTLMACLDSSGMMLDKGYTKPLSSEVVWKVERLVGIVGDVRRLTLKNPKTGIVVGSYLSAPPGTRSVPLIPPAIVHDPNNLVGVWGLVSMPIEGLEKATGAMLAFDSLGRVSGSIACNAVSGSWALDGDGQLVIKGFASTFALCTDTAQQLVQRGMNLMTSLPLNWSIDSISTSSNVELVTVSSSLTGAKLAVFTLSRFGVSYPSTPVDTTLVLKDPSYRPLVVKNPKFMSAESAQVVE